MKPTQGIASHGASLAGADCDLGRGLHELPGPLHRQHRLPRHPRLVRARLARSPVVDPQRVQRGLRLGADPGGPPRRSAGAAPAVLHRGHHLPGGLRGLRPGGLGGPPDRRAGGAGPGSRHPRAHLPRPAPARVPPVRAGHGDRRVGRHRRCRRGGWAVAGLPALLPARRLLRERREAGTAYPDVLGALLLTAGVAALALAIVEGPDWGWTSPGVVGALSAAAVILPLFVLRSAGHRAPIVELSLFRVRSFAVAGAGVLVFALGFFALLLANVLFLTSVWHYSVLRAGVALTPGPLMAALAAPIGGRLSDRFGQRVVAVPGGLLFAAGAALFALEIGVTPHYASQFLPAVLLTGAGVGLSFAAFGSAAVAELPRSRYATGSAVSSTFRQLGAVLGVSGLIAVLGTPGAADAVAAFHRVWTLVALTGALAGGTALALGRVRARNVDEPPGVAVGSAAVPPATTQGGTP